MFSDKGSTFFGIFLIFLMVTLSSTFFVLRIQKKTPTRYRELKTKRILQRHAFTKRHRFSLTKLKSKHFLLLHYPQKLSSKNIKHVKLQETAM